MSNHPGFAPSARFGPFEVDFRAGELFKNSRKIRLQDQPLRILAMLLEHPGETITREELRQKLWPNDTFVDFDHGLNNAINRLRETLCDSAENPRYIETLPRHGYRFVASVERIPPVAALERSVATSEIATGMARPDGAHGQTSNDRVTPAWPWRLRRLLFVSGVAAVLITVVFVFNFGKLRTRVFSAERMPRFQSIAVLPFENLTGDTGQEYFVDGMTDAIITDLAQIRSLRVISRTSVIQYKRAGKTLPEIARELHVDAILEGSVVRSNDQIRIDAQLIQAANDQHLWAKSYQSQLRDVVNMQNDIARAVAEEVRLHITPEEKTRLTASRPVNPDAYEDYLRGRYYLRKWTSEGTAKAFEYFQKATVEDPNYALAYAGVAEAEFRRPFLEPLSPREAMPLAAQAARRALQLDESLAEAHGALGAIKFRFDWDWAGADAEFKRALELDPNYADTNVHWEYTVFLRTANRYQESIDEAKRAKELDPTFSDGRAGLGGAYLIARKYDLAIAELRQVVARYPEGVLGYLFLGVAYEQKGLRREAISTLEQCVKLSRDPLYLASLGHAYAIFGRREDAEKILRELQERAKREYVSPISIAMVWLGLGKREEALAWLEKAYVDRSFHLVTINSWPYFDALRSEPRFQNLVRRIGLDPDRAIPR